MEARDFISDLVSWGFTQRQIEEKTGIRQGSVSKVLRGEVKDVFSKNYRALQALHTEVKAQRQAAGIAEQKAEAAAGAA